MSDWENWYFDGMKQRLNPPKKYKIDGKEVDEATYKAALAPKPPLAISPAQSPTRAVTLPNPAGGEPITLPTQVAPNMPNFPVGQLEQGLAEAAGHRTDALTLAPNAYDVQGAQNKAQAAGATAGLASLPTIDPNAPRFHQPDYNPKAFTPQTYSPQEFPTHALETIPTRPVPQTDPTASILAAIGGFIDPVAAGGFAATPLHAGQQFADKAFTDAIQRYQFQQQQNDTAYHDRLANTQQSNQAQAFNIGQSNEANRSNVGEVNRAQQYNQERAVAGDRELYSEQAAQSHERLPLVIEQGQSGVLGPSLESMSQNLKASQLAQQKAQEAEASSQLVHAAYEDAYNKWKTEGSLQARVQADVLKLQLGLIKTQERYYNTDARYGEGTTNASGGTKPMTPDAISSSVRSYIKMGVRPPDSEPEAQKAYDQVIGSGYTDPKRQTQYTGDMYDVRVKPIFTDWQKKDSHYSKTVEDAAKKWDGGHGARGTDWDLGRLERAYKAETGQEPTGDQFTNWAVIRWVSTRPQVSYEYDNIVKPAYSRLEAAVKKLEEQSTPKTPGVAQATMSGQNPGAAAKPPAPPTKKVFNEKTGDFE